MKMLYKKIALILAIIPALNGYAATCPDAGAFNVLPQFNAPQKKSFKYFGNQLLSSFYKPFHMVQDAIVLEGKTATLVGKFDYDIILHKDLEGEKVHTYLYSQGMTQWEYIGATITNRDGRVYVPIADRPVGEYMVKMVVEGDLSSATGYLNVVEPNRKTILFDIDGTLTLNDFEGVGDYFGSKVAAAHAYATEVVKAYTAKNYQIIYLTGRPYWVTEDTRQWFKIKNIIPRHLHTNPSSGGLLSLDTENYKTDYIHYLINDARLDIVRAYGNAATDINAYARAGLPAQDTYIIGSQAGNGGTQDIGGDYSYHFATVVEGTPAVECHN